MSETGLDIAWRFEAAVNSRRVPDGLVAEDCIIENLPTALTEKTYVGPEGASEWMRDMFEGFDEDAVFEQEIVRAEDDHVIGLLSIKGRGSASGAPLELRWAAVIWIRDGVIVRGAGYASRRDAFEAVERSRP
jgi:ketosteroid isomerase-like protein